MHVIPGFQSNARNTRKALHTNYAVIINSTQATQVIQEKYASEKQSITTGPWLRVLIALEWYPGINPFQTRVGPWGER